MLSQELLEEFYGNVLLDEMERVVMSMDEALRGDGRWSDEEIRRFTALTKPEFDLGIRWVVANGEGHPDSQPRYIQ